MVQIRAMINDMRERGADPKIVTLNAEDYAKAEKFLKR